MYFTLIYNVSGRLHGKGHSALHECWTHVTTKGKPHCGVQSTYAEYGAF